MQLRKYPGVINRSSSEQIKLRQQTEVHDIREKPFKNLFKVKKIILSGKRNEVNSET